MGYKMVPPPNENATEIKFTEDYSSVNDSTKIQEDWDFGEKTYNSLTKEKGSAAISFFKTINNTGFILMLLVAFAIMFVGMGGNFTRGFDVILGIIILSVATISFLFTNLMLSMFENIKISTQQQIKQTEILSELLRK